MEGDQKHISNVPKVLPLPPEETGDAKVGPRGALKLLDDIEGEQNV